MKKMKNKVTLSVEVAEGDDVSWPIEIEGVVVPFFFLRVSKLTKDSVSLDLSFDKGQLVAMMNEYLQKVKINKGEETKQ